LAAAGGAVAVGLFKAAEAAADDRRATEQLNKQLKAFGKATDADIDLNNKFIDSLQFATGVADDKLRPALGRLVRGTKNVGKAQRLLKLALDISGRTGKDLESVVEALGKASDGSTTSLFRLGIGFSKAELKGKSLDDIVGVMEQRFKGGAADAANTFEGRIERLKIRLSEAWEEIGYKVLPYFEKLADMALKVADAIAEKGLAGGIQVLRDELNRMQFEGSPLAKFLESAYNGFKTVYDIMRKMYDIALTISGGKAFNKISGLFGGPQIPTMGALPSFNQLIGADVYRGPLRPGTSTPASSFQQRYTPSNVVVNNYSADPQAVVRALQQATRRNGTLGGIRVS